MDVSGSYDTVAGEYAARIVDELRHKPFDRDLLDRFAARVAGRGTVADVGCGPGHVARYLAERGVSVTGIDLSPGMVDVARRLNPGIEFQSGDLRSIDAPDGAWAGIVAFYSLIHIPRAGVVDALREFRRVLQPDGLVLIAFHGGDEVRHLDEWWEQPVDVDFVFFTADEMARYLAGAGFELLERYERPPYPEVEAETSRVYLLSAPLPAPSASE